MKRTALGLGAAALSALAACGPASSASHGSVTHPQATHSATPAATHAAGSRAQAVAWWHGDGGKAYRVLAAALARTGSAGADFPALAAACRKEGTAVTGALAAPPPPGRARPWYAKALAKFEAGSAECRDGASSRNAGQLARATATISAGTKDLLRAFRYIRRDLKSTG